jgi:hypothetical protein
MMPPQSLPQVLFKIWGFNIVLFLKGYVNICSLKIDALNNSARNLHSIGNEFIIYIPQHDLICKVTFDGP